MGDQPAESESDVLEISDATTQGQSSSSCSVTAKRSVSLSVWRYFTKIQDSH